jgi:hypothetical protein
VGGGRKTDQNFDIKNGMNNININILINIQKLQHNGGVAQILLGGICLKNISLKISF